MCPSGADAVQNKEVDGTTVDPTVASSSR